MTEPEIHLPTIEHLSQVDLLSRVENDEPIMLGAAAGRDATELTAAQARAVGLALIELADNVGCPRLTAAPRLTADSQTTG